MSASEKPLHMDISVTLPLTYSHRLMAQEPIRTQSGTVRIVDSSNCPAAKVIAGGLIEIEPDGMRELHWGSDSDELQYYIERKARMTVYASGSDEQTFSITRAVTSATCGRACRTILRTLGSPDCASSNCGSPIVSLTFRWPSGWHLHRTNWSRRI